MENSSQRTLRPLIPASNDLPTLMVELARALAGKGPALGFGDIRTTRVPEGVAVVTATSGSTRTPKEVGLSASALLSSARASHAFLGATFGQVWSLLLPLSHIAGINVLVRSLELGTMPVDLRDSSHKRRQKQRYKKTDFTAIVPTQLFRALNGETELLEHLKTCRAVLVGGAALAPALATRAKAAGINLVTTYGMSETSGGCVYNGRPLSGVEVRIIEGTVAIKGTTLASTYINDEPGWQESLQDGWLITHDRGTYVNGRLEILGRADDVIVSGGEKVSISAVEETLKAHFAGVELAAFAVPDPEWGSTLHIAIAADTLISDAEISSLLAQTFGEVGKPKGFHRLLELPLIGIGKIDRSALVQLAQRGLIN
ncbi:MAG TPA: AMP-binding protein [Candidatus Paceibacterota bacterium]|nr:AMP-binding protein [Candidatus Paceibacterota bacterium]